MDDKDASGCLAFPMGTPTAMELEMMSVQWKLLIQETMSLTMSCDWSLRLPCNYHNKHLSVKIFLKLGTIEH